MQLKQLIDKSRILHMRLRQLRPVCQTGVCIFCGEHIVEGPPDFKTIGEHKSYCDFLSILEILKEAGGE